MAGESDRERKQEDVDHPHKGHDPGRPGAEGGEESPAADALPGAAAGDSSPLGDTDQHSNA